MTTPRPQPKPDSRKYQDLIADIEKGVIKIPKFQREFVWPIEKTAALLDSIVKGYPIGTFILWKTNQRMADVRDVGNISLPATPDDRQVEYVLDGQQRMTSLFAACRGAKLARAGSGKITDFANIYVNLDPSLSDEAQIVVHEMPESSSKCVSLKDVLSLNRQVARRLVDDHSLDDDDLDAADKFRQAFATYDFSIVTLTREDINSAIEVFTRINTGGSVLTLFEVVVAKTYDEYKKFDMQVEWSKLEGELDYVGYSGISPSIILQLLALVLAGEAKRATVLSLDKDQIVEIWPKAVDAIKSAVDHFRTAYRIPVSALLPYDSLIVPFAYWFFVKRYEPSGASDLRMRQFFWRSSLSYRYSSAVESKLAADKRAIDDIISGGSGNWDIPVSISGPEGIIRTNFATGNSLCKAILCLLAYEMPRNFHNDGMVLLDNSYLKIASSKNFHHFFPRDHLRSRGISGENSVANITLIGADLNRRQINAKPPKLYIPKFETSNHAMSSTLATHLIERHGMGIDEDDYELFIAARAAKIWGKIKERIDPVI